MKWVKYIYSLKPNRFNNIKNVSSLASIVKELNEAIATGHFANVNDKQSFIQRISKIYLFVETESYHYINI